MKNIKRNPGPPLQAAMLDFTKPKLATTMTSTSKCHRNQIYPANQQSYDYYIIIYI